MSTTYSCGRCGRGVSKSTRRCPHCSALLAGIRCQGCNFVGAEGDFPGDRCPRCGGAVSAGGGGGSAPMQESCKGCGRLISLSDWTCPHCGYTQWGMVVGLGVFSLVVLAGAAAGYLTIEHPFGRNVVGWGAGLLGVACLLTAVAQAVIGLRARK